MRDIDRVMGGDTKWVISSADHLVENVGVDVVVSVVEKRSKESTS
jgi:hypothetical protein